MLVYPYAKINIGLNVVEKRPDGYHNLETVFYPIPLHDVLEVKPLTGSNAPFLLQQPGSQSVCAPEDNLVIKVYNSLKEEFDLPPVDIFLDKKIPTGAGLGGGSSDAAAMMNLLNEEYALGLSVEERQQRVARLGADCAFFITSQPAYATGIGDILTPLPDLSLRGWTILLVKPPVFVSTKEAYSQVVPKAAGTNLTEALMQPIETWRTTVKNDFERSVFAIHPQLSAIKQTLYDMGAAYAAMSGSGSTLFGIFRNKPLARPSEIFSDCFTYQAKFLV